MGCCSWLRVVTSLSLSFWNYSVYSPFGVDVFRGDWTILLLQWNVSKSCKPIHTKSLLQYLLGWEKKNLKYLSFFIFRNACYATNLSDAIKKYSMTWNEQRKETNGQTNREREGRMVKRRNGGCKTIKKTLCKATIFQWNKFGKKNSSKKCGTTIKIYQQPTCRLWTAS